MCARSTFIGAVEIGTSKIAVLIGEQTDREVIVIGFGECVSRGVIKGSVVDYREAGECVAAALRDAEHTANQRIDHVYLAQSGEHLEGFYNEGAISVRATNNMIEAQDIAKVCDLARGKDLPRGRSIVQEIRRPFLVDGRLVPTSPENLVGQKLEVGYWTVHGDEQKIADHIHVVAGFNLEVQELILSSVASGTIVTSPEERQNGVLVIDVGAGITDFVLYRNGTPHTTGVVAVGGGHFTNDLCIGLRLPREHAEKIKHRFGRAVVDERNKTEKVWLHGNYAIGDRSFARREIEKITAARARELMEVVRKKLGSAFSPESCQAGVVLSGGASKLPAIAKCATNVFVTHARLGEPFPQVHENLRDPGYHTALGILYYGFSAGIEPVSDRRRAGSLRSFLRRLFP
jgi:cell division protein FtsA